MAPHPSIPIDPETGIPDLVRRLGDDSKRLANDEIRLAKLELRESVREGTSGVLRMGIAGAFAVIAAVALTILLVAGVSRLLGHYWAGAIVVGVAELLIGVLAVVMGSRRLKSPPNTLDASRESLKDTAAWLRDPVRR